MGIFAGLQMMLKKVVNSLHEPAGEPGPQLQLPPAAPHSTAQPPISATVASYPLDDITMNGTSSCSQQPTVAEPAARLPYKPSNYMPPVEVDPSVMASIGPISSGMQTLSVRPTSASDPGAAMPSMPGAQPAMSGNASHPGVSSLSSGGVPSAQSNISLAKENPYLVMPSRPPYSSSSTMAADAATGASQFVVDSDPAAQNRTLQLLIVRLQNTPSETTLKQLHDCITQVSHCQHINIS